MAHEKNWSIDIKTFIKIPSLSPNSSGQSTLPMRTIQIYKGVAVKIVKTVIKDYGMTKLLFQALFYFLGSLMFY